MKIHIVQGSTGEYSDCVSWFVGAFFSEDKAQERVLKATERANELGANGIGYSDIPDGANEFDPGMQVDYSGVRYEYSPVEILDNP